MTPRFSSLDSAWLYGVVDVVVISWQGFLEKSIAIAKDFAQAGGKVHIIHSQEDPLTSVEEGEFSVSLVNNEDFFGRKFRKALEIVGDKPFLLVQADAHCDDWAKLLKRFREILGARPIGVWAPAIHHTSWVNRKVFIKELGKDNLLQVSQTDAIVIGFSQAVVKRLRSLDFSNNNLGWGIEWAAICYSMASGQLAVRDLAAKVQHKVGSGYHQSEARRQQEVFLDQLTDSEKAVLILLRRSHQVSRPSVKLALRHSQLCDNALSSSVTFAKKLLLGRKK